MELTNVRKIFDEIATVSGKKDKEKIIRDNKDNELFKECLKFLLDSEIVTGLSTKKMNKNVPIYDTTWNNIEDAFEYIKKHNTGTDSNISMIKTFCKAQGEDKEFCEQLFTKKLKVGVDSKTVNKVIPGLIPEFNIMLGSKFDFEKPPIETMWVTEKLDGIRCFTIIKDGQIIMKSRQNKRFEGLEDIENAIKQTGLDNICLDGELLSIDSLYENVYKDTTKKVNNKNKRKYGVKYCLFDIVPLEEFESGKGEVLYSQRREMLDKINTSEFLEIVPILYEGEDMDIILSILNAYRDMGAEGLMVSLDKHYDFKRSKALLKLKVMQSCDLKIIGFEEGQGRLKGTLGKIICDYKGFNLGVGSGFTDSMRDEIWNNQEKYLHRVAEINYFEETHNEEGELSLRFPIFKCVREEGKEVSYH